MSQSRGRTSYPTSSRYLSHIKSIDQVTIVWLFRSRGGINRRESTERRDNSYSKHAWILDIPASRINLYLEARPGPVCRDRYGVYKLEPLILKTGSRPTAICIHSVTGIAPSETILHPIDLIKRMIWPLRPRRGNCPSHVMLTEAAATL